METRLNSETETAQRLKLKNPRTLSVWRSTRRYPLEYIRVGRKIFYSDEAIEKFLRLRTESGIGRATEPKRGPRRSGLGK